MANDAAGPEEGRQPTVLVIEDNETACLGLAATLAREGYLVRTAGTGHDAIGILGEPASAIDVVILDVGLPDVSGIAVCARLRETCPALPVIVCTGEATPEEVAQLLKLGAHRYFQKPVSPDEVLSAVEAALP